MNKVWGGRFRGDINTGNKTFEILLFQSAEIFGKVFNKAQRVISSERNAVEKNRSFNDIGIAIREEYEKIFWATGSVTKLVSFIRYVI